MQEEESLADWATRRILVLGRTYMHYSSSHIELACTGGIMDNTGLMLRLHPVPFRYFEDARRFKEFQWIEVRARKHPDDTRPESLQIDPVSLHLQEHIPAKNVDARLKHLQSSPHLVRSVEELEDLQQVRGQSLGIVRPARITDVRLEKRTEEERRAWEAKDAAVRSQLQLFGERPKPIDFPEVKFVVSWDCDDERCDGHSMGMQQDGLHQLYRRLVDDPERKSKVRDAMWRRLDSSRRDVYLFMGNFLNRRYAFGLMGSYEHDRKASTQPQLF